jgi:ATP-dependent protease HslVU (ClpYQ) peptidase subunit
MTTIAWDGRRLAADRLVNADGLKIRYAKKISHIARGQQMLIVACAGLVADSLKFEKWLREGGEHPTLDDNFEAIVIDAQNNAVTYCNDLVALERDAPYALGSGTKVALGALHAGADAKRAVEIGCELDLYTGGEIDVVVTA